MKNNKGFTLVEIIVVLVILAILAAATIPSMLGFVEQAKSKAVAAEARMVAVAAQAYATEELAKATNITTATNEIKTALETGAVNDESHVLKGYVKDDANGTISGVTIENGKVKILTYTKPGAGIRPIIFNDGKVEFGTPNPETTE